MSRCFPYPPPGYEPKIRVDDLIDSIKREKEKAQKRKEKKKEKKEKHGKRKSEEKKHLSKETEWRGAEESEQLEKSDLTEEYKQPAKVQGFHYSSDSTQTSSKRKKHGTDTNIADNHVNGLCFCLSLRKHKVPELPSNELPCSSSRDNTRAQEPETAHEHCAYKSDFLGKEAAAFRDLIYNWKLPAMSMLEKLEFDNQEWLFERKQQCRQDTRKRKLDNCSMATIKNNLWPRACHLSTLDVFALPYTVPY